MKKNKIILSLMIVLVSVVVNAQNLVVYTNDGVETFFEISSIDSIKIISQEDISNVDTDIFSNLEKDEMVLVKGGTFTMGATSEQGSDYDGDELPTHQVTLSDYYIGKYEVTQELYEAVMGVNPSNFKDSPADGEIQKLRPVEGIYWYHAILFCNKLSIKMGLDKCYIITQSDGSEIDYDNIDFTNIKTIAPTWQISYKLENNGYRLPTEAEWEFAARGGNQDADDWNYTYAGSNNIEGVAWYNEDGNRSTKITHEVGLKNANRIGLYDMSGNCWEFCSDRSNTVSTGEVTDPVASGTGCVRRGGGFYEEESTNIFNRSYQGETTLTTFLYEDNGFRIARTVK